MNTIGTTTVSVVMPVGPETTFLHIQLRALASQKTHRTVEVIFSCNGVSATKIQALTRFITWPTSWHIRFIDSSAHPGPSGARNIGWRHAQGAMILFCDADDRVAPDWLEALASSPAEITGGRLTYSALNPSYLSGTHTTGSTGLPVRFHHLPYAPSCNLAVSRDLLLDLNGFSEDLPCAEDTDLCWRAAKLGYPIRFEPAALVDYRLRAGAKAIYRQARAYGHWDAALLARHHQDGARWTMRDSAHELASLLASVLKAPTSHQAYLRASARVGSWIGRISGSFRHQRYVA